MSLTINGKIVNKLSGPISMYLLFPTDEYLALYPNAPIFILFGDNHRDGQGFCQDSDKIGSYKVFDPNFLQLLSDAIGKKNEELKENRMIDFYLEGGEIHKFGITKYPMELPMEQLWSLFTKCYNNRYETTQDLTDIDKENCGKMKNIRWQSGDIRFFKEEWDKFTLANMFQSIEHDLFEDVKPPEDGKMDMPYVIKSRFRVEVIKAGGNIDYIKNFNCSAYHVYEEYVLNEKSLIFKQLIKIPDNDVIRAIQAKFKEYIDDFMSMYERDELYEYDSIADIFKTLFMSELYSKESEDALDKIYNYYNGRLNKFIKFIEMRRSVMLDLYTLARSYKRMLLDTYPKPIINMCYFGDIHIVNICNFLTKRRSTQGRTYSDYELIMNAEVTNGVEPRCLNMAGSPSIDKLIAMLMKQK